MPKEYRFLLVSDPDADLWEQMLEETSASLGALQIAPAEEALRLIRQQDYDMIVIDATKVEDVFLLTSSIRLQKPDARVVIATTSPTWTRAREAFRAGATDYIRKALNKEELRSVLLTTMNKPPPPWRR